jgi:hypothetical protein
MTKHILIIASLLALAGCSFGRSVSVQVTTDGHDNLHSQVTITRDLAIFHCIASDTGACHYTIYDRPCPDQGPCDAKPVRAFAVGAGDRMIETTLPEGFVSCVSGDEAAKSSCAAGVTRA